MRFNLPIGSPSQTTNNAGAPAHELAPELQLYNIACCSLLADSYYQSESALLIRLRDLVKQVSPEFATRLAVYTRHEMGLRTLPGMIAVLNCIEHSGSRWARRGVRGVVKRVDDMTEMLGFYASLNTANHIKATKGAHVQTKSLRKISRALLRGLRDVMQMGRFDEYQYAKYDRAGAITLKDLVQIVRPSQKPLMIHTSIFTKIIEGKLETPYTWEVELSKIGQNKDLTPEGVRESKMLKWNELITSGKLGHMALVRNLRNILELSPPPAMIENLKLQFLAGVKKAGLFPTQYWVAYDALKNMALDPFTLAEMSLMIEDALKQSMSSVPEFEGKTVVACDVSGSMQQPLHSKSKVSMIDVGIVLGSVMKVADPRRTFMMLFAQNVGVVDPTIDQVLHNINAAKRLDLGGSTDGWKIIHYMLSNKLKVDNLVFFTDCELYNSQTYGGGSTVEEMFNQYRNQVNPEARLYMVNLAASTHASPIRITENVIFVSGWSDKVFDAIELLRRGGTAIDMIKQYDRNLT